MFTPSLDKLKLYLFFVVLILVGGTISFNYPVLFCIIISFFSILLVNNINYKYTIFLFCMFLFFFGMAMDPTEYISDYSRYYLSFYQDHNEIILTGKMYRFFIFSLLKYIDFRPQVYTGISIFLIFYIYLVYSIKFASLNRDLEQKHIYIIVLIVILNMPSATIGNFESTLSMSILFAALYYLAVNNRKKAFCYILFAPLVHPAAIPFSLLLLPILTNRKTLFQYSSFMIISGFVTIVFFLNMDFSLISPYGKHLQNKLVFFLFQSDWSKYIERRDFEILFIGVLKLCLVLYCLNFLKKYKSNEVHIEFIKNISAYLIMFFIATLISRTLAERYLYFGFIIYLPLIMTLIALKESKRFLLTVLVTSSMIFIAPQNIIIYGVLTLKSTTPETLSFDLVELLTHEYNKVSSPEKDRVLTN